MKLRTKIFLTFSILATIPLVLFTLFSYGRYSQVTYQRMDDISSHLMENAEYTANATLNSIQQTAGAFNFYYNDGSSIISDLKHFKNANSRPSKYLIITLYHKVLKRPARTFSTLMNLSMEFIFLRLPDTFLKVQPEKTARSTQNMIFRIRTGIRIPFPWMVPCT